MHVHHTQQQYAGPLLCSPEGHVHARLDALLVDEGAVCGAVVVDERLPRGPVVLQHLRCTWRSTGSTR